MTFRSILNEQGSDETVASPASAPECFRDLNLDQIVDAITAGKQEYDLQPFFGTSLTTVEAIEYRHEIMRDLQEDRILQCITAFAERMRTMRRQLVQANKLHYVYQKQRWQLDAIRTYCTTVEALKAELPSLGIQSRGLRELSRYLDSYTESDPFRSVREAADSLLEELGTLSYSIHVRGNSVTVRRYGGEPDYSDEVTEAFKRFNQGEVPNYLVTSSESVHMSHVEENILTFVARLFPDTFSRLTDFCTQNHEFSDPTLVGFDREIHFYVAYIEYMRRAAAGGLPFCYPAISTVLKDAFAEDTVDLALAHRLLETNKPIVLNDFALHDEERIFIVSGPNQGGKTTFARTFGQLHHLASIGCPVPGRRARLFLCDRIFTHFEREEHIENLRGKLEEDLLRIRDVLAQATPSSIVIINEIFSSTALADAYYLAKAIIRKIVDFDLLCVCVTFLDQLAWESEKIVSMVSTVDADDPAVRTYKVVRRRAGGRSYAMSLAEKHRLTYECIKARIPG